MSRKSAYLLAGFVLIFSSVVSVFLAGKSAAQTATQFTGLTVTPASTELSATTIYTFSFAAPRALVADDPDNQQPGDSIMVEFMSNGPENDSTKIDLSNASLGSGTNVNASLQTADPAHPRERNITLGQNVAVGAVVTLELTGVVNPVTAGQYSGRVSFGGPSGDSYYAQQNLVLGMGTTYTISGQVTLQTTGAGVADAQVQAQPSTGGSLSFGVDADSSGNYSMLLPAGDWKFRVEAQWDQSTGDQKDVNWAYMGSESTTTVSADTTVNLQVSPTTKTVSGKVTYAGTSTPVTDAQVNANLRRGMGWRSASTDSSGSYTLKVPGGEWEVRVEPQWSDGSRVAVDWAYSGRGEMVSFASDTSTETATVNISVVKATATVKGKLLDPDGNVADGWIDLRSKDGAGVGGGVDFDTGVFSISVPAGSYNVGIWVNDQTLTAPQISSFTIADNQTKDLGTITLVKKTSKITGSVTDKDTGAGIAGVRVNAWSPGGSGWAETTSGGDGSYTLTVGAGTYEVMAEPGSEIGYASTQSGPPTRIEISQDQTVSGINFKLVQANNVISGTVVDINGNQLTSFFGFAMAMEGDGDPPKPGPGGPAEGGSFSLAVPDGTWTVNVETEPGSDYSSTGAQTVVVSGGQTATVTITMKQNDAAITGTIRDEDGNAVTGVRAEVFAENGRGSFKFTNADSSDGTYNLGVVGGDSWYLGVFVEPGSGYMMLPPADSKTTVNSGETVTKDFALLKANATISGKVTDPDGNGLSGVFVFADTNMVDDGAVLGLSTINESGPAGGPGGKLDSGVHTGDLTDADGNYTLEVPAGTYGVGSGAPASLGYINPEFKRVAVAKDEAALSINLQYRAADATISGSVTLDGSATEAFVWAWSETGAHSENYTRTGDYTLNVTKGEVWHVGADYDADQKFYQSSEYVVDLSDGSTSATQNLALSETSFTLPPSVSQQIDAAQGGTVILEDGLRVVIPAGAFGSSGTYTVTITPTAQLAKEKSRRPLAFGYRITALDSNGQELTSSFNSNVRLVIPYTDAMLTALGITEDNLNADFFDSTSSAWQGVDSFTVNKEDNTVVASISHFTDFALTTGAGTAATPTSTPTTAPTATPTPTSAALPATGVPIGEALGFYLTRLLGLVGLTTPAYLYFRRK